MKHHMQVPLKDTKGELHTGSTQHTLCSRPFASQKRGWSLGCPGGARRFLFLGEMDPRRLVGLLAQTPLGCEFCPLAL